MSEREIDEILKELKQHAESEHEPAKSEPAPALQQTAKTEEEPKEVITEEVIPEPVEEKEPQPEPAPERAAEPEKAAETPEPEAEPEEDSVDLFTLTGDDDDKKSENLTEPTEIKEEPYEAQYDDEESAAPKRNKVLVMILSILLLVGIIACVYLGIMAFKGGADFEKGEQQTQAVTAVQTAVNPLTGEDDFSSDAVGKRPVAVVAENEYGVDAVRPQWGLNYADIVLEGETEFSTRLLLFFADYSKIPAQVGPARSARPPFIRFSEFFDSIFIHAGLSHSKGDYEGADTVFENDRVDHINLLNYPDDGKYTGRDSSRTTITEHTCYFNGKNTKELLKEAKIVTDIEKSKFTALPFNKKAQPLSDTEAKSVKFRWSGEHCKKTVEFKYDSEEGAYTTADFDSPFGKANVQFQNVILILDKTEYIVKNDYKGAGNSETYCNYLLEGGNGVILSQGTSVDIKWSVENGKLVFKNKKGEQVKLNPGKSYIGYGSSNNGGKITVK